MTYADVAYIQYRRRCCGEQMFKIVFFLLETCIKEAAFAQANEFKYN